MRQKIHTLVVGAAIIVAAAVQTELNQTLRVRQLQAQHRTMIAGQLK